MAPSAASGCDFFATYRPEQVYLAAAKVGGILANDRYPADFIHHNLMIEANVIHAAHRHGVQRLLLLGSSCIYPRLAAQPMRAEALLTGTLEPTIAASVGHRPLHIEDFSICFRR